MESGRGVPLPRKARSGRARTRGGSVGARGGCPLAVRACPEPDRWGSAARKGTGCGHTAHFRAVNAHLVSCFRNTAHDRSHAGRRRVRTPQTPQRESSLRPPSSAWGEAAGSPGTGAEEGPTQPPLGQAPPRPFGTRPVGPSLYHQSSKKPPTGSPGQGAGQSLPATSPRAQKAESLTAPRSLSRTESSCLNKGPRNFLLYWAGEL